MPPRVKKPATHERSSTHNSNSQGLAPPGRRITKQKSIPQLGSPQQQSNGSPQPLQSPTAATDLLDRAASVAPSSDPKPADGVLPDSKMGAAHPLPNGRHRNPSGASQSGWDPHDAGHALLDCASPLRLDVNGTAKAAYKNNVSTLALTKTILRACPLGDVIAILIILLQLPPTIISIVHFLFVALTFVTPSQSLSTPPSLNEVLLGSGGTLSLPVIISLDAIALVIFCMVTVPMQNVGLEIAQAVIAISLGGAAASRGGTTQSVGWCFLIIFASHLFRWTPARQLGVSLLWSGLAKSGFQPSSGPPVLGDLPGRLWARPGWPRSVLGVHILVQGLVRMVRRYLLWRDAEPLPPASMTKTDTETGNESVINTPRSNSYQFESATNLAAGVGSSTDGRPPGPSPAARDGKDKNLSSRKKRRQATHVRSQQPFWAAIASTKVTFIKELEQSQASVDSIEASSADLSNMGHTDFTAGSERVWIRDVSSSEIHFGLTFPSIPSPKRADTDDDTDSDTPAVVCKRPFYIRLNGAIWSSVKIGRHENRRIDADFNEDVWLGKLFGLTAYAPYQIEVVRVVDDTIIFAESIVTLPAPSSEPATIGSAPSQTLRPSSPTTTLKNSIAAADQHLDSVRNRLKRNRKDHKALLSGIQKDVDSLSSRMSSSSSSDDRHRSRIKQLEQSIRRAEEDADEMETEAGKLGDIPENEMSEWTQRRAYVRKQRELHLGSVQDLKDSKDGADIDIEKAMGELQAVQQKHHKSQQRLAKISERHESLVNQKVQVQEDKMRRALDRSTALDHRNQEEQKILTFIARYHQDAQNEQIKAVQLKAQSKHLEDTFFKAHIALQGQNQQAPTSPEFMHPGTPGNRNSFPMAQASFASFPYSPSNGTFVDPSVFMNGSHAQSNPALVYHNVAAHAQRRRSGSMHSAFIDDLAGDHLGAVGSTIAIPHSIFSPASAAALPIGASRGVDRRKSSQGSGSGSGSSGSGNSSIRDPMSPPPKKADPLGSSALHSPLGGFAKSKGHR